jgi:hypothetical protein
MPIKLLQREISKPISPSGPINTGGFYSRKHLPTDLEKRYLQALWNFLPEEKIAEVRPDPNSISKERQS